MSFKLLFLMDPYPTLNLETETSLLCMDELQRLGHRVYWVQQEQLLLAGDQLSGDISEVITTAPFQLAARKLTSLDNFDALVIRKDPPFDSNYLHLTYLLAFLPPSVAAINNPAALRNINEKMATLHWAADCPATIVTMNAGMLGQFVTKHGRVVIKPLDDCSGRGIEFTNAGDPDMEAKLASKLTTNGEGKFLLAQAYLPGVQLGDKRVFMINGKPAGWVNRVPAPGKDLANIHQGASCETTSLTNQESQLCSKIGQWLVDEGVLLAGLDFIDGKLTEINITSPSAVRQINAVSNIQLEQQIVAGILDVIDNRRTSS